MSMHFRTKSIADSVTERITAIAESVRNNSPMPASRGSAVVSLNRGQGGELMVTKTFENGETELLTISNQEPSSTQPPEGIVQIGGDETAPVEEQLSAGIGDGGILESAALGGDSLDALVRG